MNYISFGNLFFKFLTLNISIYIVCILFNFYFFRHELTGIFDVLVPNYILPISSIITVIFFLYVNNLIEFVLILELFIYFLLILIGYKNSIFITRTKKKYKTESYYFFSIFYFLHSVIFSILFLYYFLNFGTAAVGMNNKVTIRYNNGTIFYLINIFPTGQNILFFIKRKIYKHKSKKDYIPLLFTLILTFISGSKAGFLNWISILFTSNILIDIVFLNKYRKIKFIGLKEILLISLSIVSIIVYAIIEGSISDKQKMILSIFLKFFEFGDIYYLSIPDGYYKSFSDFSLLTYLLAPTLGPLRRLIPFQENSILGFKIIEHVYNIKTPQTGPTARTLFVFLITEHKILNCFLSYFFGLLFGKVRKLNIFLGSFLGIYISLFLVSIIHNVFVDFSSFMDRILPISVIIVLYLISVLIYYSTTKIGEKRNMFLMEFIK